MKAGLYRFLAAHVKFILLLLGLSAFGNVCAQTRELNSTGGTSATNGLHFYIDNTSKIQVRRLNDTGQVYSPTVTPPNNNLDNGVFLRANNVVYGPSHTVTGFAPTAYNTATIGVTSPANPSSNGVQQTVTNVLGVTAGPQLTINWKYTTPLDFMTAEVTLVIPAGYSVSPANPVRYYHVFDTYLGGSDQGCGVNVAGPPRIVGTYSSLGGATPCPTSTSLPASGTVVESFRERTGTFSRYCAAGWSSFFVNGGVNCSVLQAAQMSNTITTSLQDTGIGIEYDFTATGTYTFSYDFVIGTTTVPPYDHIEIRHDGSATLCPENIVVVACTNAGASCTPVSTGTISGNVSFTSAAPGVTFSPAGFSVGGSGTSANLVMQATSASAGTYTLVATGLNVAPLNGTKCTNLAGNVATSCDIVIANTACVANFDCLESSLAYSNRNVAGNRNPLYTKLVNTAFAFDVVALDSAGNIAPSFTGNVDVILYDDSANPVCTAATAISGGSQTLSFAAGDNGRKTLAAITLANAYKDLRCRATATGVTPAVTACSSDAFTVRPQSITSITSSTANASAGGNNQFALPIVKAGATFNLTATTGVLGYDGTPQVNNALLNWAFVPAGGLVAPGVGSVAGTFSPANSATGTATGSSFTYSEAGYFSFLPLGVIDMTFSDGSGDITKGDCTSNASNTLDVNKKYGCRFGNTVDSNHFGRFVPDHFTVTGTSLSKGCIADDFTYMDQPFALNATIEARNSSDARTFNYSGAYAKSSMTPEAENNNNGVTLSARLSASGTWNGGVNSFSVTKFSRASPADGPYDLLNIGVAVSDPEGSLLTDRNMQATTTSCIASSPNATNGDCSAHQLNPTAMSMRHGRLRLANVYGSERLALPIPMIVEYWAGTPSAGNFVGWTKNTNDLTCTVPVAANFALAFPTGIAPKTNNLAACETALSVLPLKLSAPGVGNNGWVDVSLNLGAAASGTQCIAVGGAGPAATTMNAPWLQFNWDGSGLSNPKARAHFGVYKKSNQVIYTREVH
ncbi:MAG: hypothetical protein HY253_10830 [Burkholderiales bacterium]|nr:hypothetical protein [Burkholderiales bacterium]